MAVDVRRILGSIPYESNRPEDWAPIFEKVILQVFYRVLGMVSIPIGIDLAARAIDLLCRQGKGRWRWLVTGSALVWEDAPIDAAAKVYAYIFGGPRQKNTVLVRSGFWRMYVLESAMTAIDRLRVRRYATP